MASQSSNPDRDTQQGRRKPATPEKRGSKVKDEQRENADVSGANDTGNKSQGGKFDSGNQTNR